MSLRLGSERPVGPAGTPDGPRPPAGAEGPPSVRSGIAWGLLWISLLSFILLAAHNARPGGDLDERIANPAVKGHPRPVTPLFDDPHWMTKLQLGTLAMVAIVLVVCVVLWRRHPRHPILLMAIACEAILWMDPIMNW